MKKFLFIFVMLPAVASVSAEDHIDLVKKGNKEYESQNFSKALEYYHSAETELPASPELEYNIAGALHQQGKYEETVDRYTKALNSNDITVEQRAQYNLGNTYYRTGEYDKAITSYQNALNIDPTDMEAKFNLELARRRLKEQINPEQPGGEQQQEPQQQQEQQPEQQEQPQPDDQQQQQEQQEQTQQEEMQEDDKDISREDAERILNALRDDERELQKQIKRQENKGDYLGKDW